MDDKDIALLQKLLDLTYSDQDGEALLALRKAQSILKKYDGMISDFVKFADRMAKKNQPTVTPPPPSPPQWPNNSHGFGAYTASTGGLGAAGLDGFASYSDRFNNPQLWEQAMAQQRSCWQNDMIRGMNASATWQRDFERTPHPQRVNAEQKKKGWFRRNIMS